MDKKEKLAVVLLNLGGPDKPSSIKPFLLNFFNDPLIIRAPKPIRKMVAWLIARKRSKKEAFESYNRLGGKSPLLENTKLQALALEEYLHEQKIENKVFVCMRYWHPMADEVVAAVREFAPTQIILLPLYPQFSTTTTLSSFRDFTRAMTAQNYQAPLTEICCYPFHKGFIEQSVLNIKKAIVDYKNKYGDKPYRLLFSAHGLPQNVVDKGDPYQVQCEQSAERMAKALAIEGLDWQICYQSRVGPLKWIGPSTEEVLEKAQKDEKGVIIYPHAFVSEHVETLVEIEEEYREMAEHMGLHAFQRVDTVMAGPLFIEALGDIVKRFQGKIGAFSDQGGSLCPNDCAQCYLKIKDNPKCKI